MAAPAPAPTQLATTVWYQGAGQHASIRSQRVCADADADARMHACTGHTHASARCVHFLTHNPPHVLHHAPGFVHADTNDAKKLPGMTHVKAANEMLAKKNIKKTRNLHPLFGRGFDTALHMTVRR